jgi:hypothetical protein
LPPLRRYGLASRKPPSSLRRPKAFGAQLSKYVGYADQLEQHITDAKNKPAKPKLFGNLDFGSDTQEAFNAFEAEHKLMSIEKEIRHEFLYGAFCNLEGGYGSLDGYRKFLEMRRKIRAERIRMKQEQEDDAKEVLGRHVSLWWQFNRRGGWVRGAWLILQVAKLYFLSLVLRKMRPTLLAQCDSQPQFKCLRIDPTQLLVRRFSTRFSQTQRPRLKRRSVLWRWRSGVSLLS